MPHQGQKYVIVGGAGLVGSGVAHSLITARNADVIICDTLGDVGNGKWANLPPAMDDLWTPESLLTNLDKAWREIAGVIVLADPGQQTQDGDALLETAFHLPRRIWDYCAAKQRPLFWASSAHVYGNGRSQLSTTPSDIIALAPTTPFGVAKRAFDLFAARTGVGPNAPPVWAGLRLSSVYGKGESHKGALASLPARAMTHAKADTTLELWQHSNQHTRDWVHVDDAAKAIAGVVAGEHGGFFDIGTGIVTSTQDLLAYVEAILGKPLKTTPCVEPQERSASLAGADVSALRALGISVPFRTLKQGLSQL